MARRLSTPPAPRQPKAAAGASARTHPLVSLTKRTLVHQLQVHQLGLEQQNQELLRMQRELVAARDRFIDLFDFAPVAYLTLDRGGRIVEANLTAAADLGLDRAAMLGRRFAQYVAPFDGDRWNRVAARTFERQDLRRVELTLLREDGGHFQADLDCRRVLRAGSHAQLRVTLTDATQRRLAERNRRIAASASLARESERRALAFRLHEGLGQRLAAVQLHLGALAATATTASHRAVVETMVSELDQALALVRRLSTDLHPLMLADLGLGAALDWLARDVAARLGLRAELHVDDDEPGLDESLAISIYRLTEMALAHFARFVSAGLSIELLQRPRDWILLFQCAPGHGRSDAPCGPLLALPEAFRDQVHLLGGHLSCSELAGGICRVFVCIGAQACSAPAPPDAGDAA